MQIERWSLKRRRALIAIRLRHKQQVNFQSLISCVHTMHVSRATMIRWETQWMPWNGLGRIFAFFRSVLYAYAACKVHNFLRATIRKFTRKRNATGGAMRSTFNSWVRGYMLASGFDSNSAPSKWYQGSWTTVNNLSVAVSRVNFDRRTRKSPSNVIIVNKFTKRPLMLRRSYQKYRDSYFINGQTLLPKKEFSWTA